MFDTRELLEWASDTASCLLTCLTWLAGLLLVAALVGVVWLVRSCTA